MYRNEVIKELKPVYLRKKPKKLEMTLDEVVVTTTYSRRGYIEDSMNTNELVWNARLTKRMMKGKILLQLDAFDILGNLTNVRRTINAQGKTETFYNIIPSYCLLHLTWRLK
ncbi:MAG: hypothetical protein MR421_09705 [Prevotella sp.]|nr:hypothetical protein [Prevotella sp.]